MGMEETDTEKGTLGIYVSAGRFKAIVDMMDSDITIASDGEKMSISSAIGKQFVGLIYPLDQGVIIPNCMGSHITAASQEAANFSSG